KAMCPPLPRAERAGRGRGWGQSESRSAHQQQLQEPPPQPSPPLATLAGGRRRTIAPPCTSLHRRRAVGVERGNRPQAPGLALLALGFSPRDRLPVWRQNEARAGVRHLDPVAARFVDIKKEGLLD